MVSALPQTGADLAALTAAGIVLCVAGMTLLGRWVLV
jgi:LPXTG-motif cell wall-anchored protein